LWEKAIVKMNQDERSTKARVPTMHTVGLINFLPKNPTIAPKTIRIAPKR
jgi:hypothetical protein